MDKGGSDVDMRDFSGQTPLIYAARFGHFDVVRYLVAEAGADAKVVGGVVDGKSALEWAVVKGNKDVANYLRKRN